MQAKQSIFQKFMPSHWAFNWAGHWGVPKDRLDHILDHAASQSCDDAVEIKAILHDINNNLMLVTIAADQLEQASHQALADLCEQDPQNSVSDGQSEMAGHANPSRYDYGQILRENVRQIKGLLEDLGQHISPINKQNTNVPDRSYHNLPHNHLDHISADLPLWGYDEICDFLQRQSHGWQVMMGSDAKLSITHQSFDGVIGICELHLARIMSNLLFNSVEAYQNAADDKPPLHISLSYKCSGKWLTIQITDNGPGIPAGLNPFAPYQSTKMPDSSHKARLPTGIGLVSVRTSAACMGGTVSLTKSSKEGSQFVLSLPFARPNLTDKTS